MATDDHTIEELRQGLGIERVEHEIGTLTAGLKISDKLQHLEGRVSTSDLHFTRELHGIDKRLTTVEGRTESMKEAIAHLHVHIREIQAFIHGDGAKVHERLASMQEWLNQHDRRDTSRMWGLGLIIIVVFGVVQIAVRFLVR